MGTENNACCLFMKTKTIKTVNNWDCSMNDGMQNPYPLEEDQFIKFIFRISKDITKTQTTLNCIQILRHGIREHSLNQKNGLHLKI